MRPVKLNRLSNSFIMILQCFGLVLQGFSKKEAGVTYRTQGGMGLAGSPLTLGGWGTNTSSLSDQPTGPLKNPDGGKGLKNY